MAIVQAYDATIDITANVAVLLTALPGSKNLSVGICIRPMPVHGLHDRGSIMTKYTPNVIGIERDIDDVGCL